jgi:hypothetical protein
MALIANRVLFYNDLLYFLTFYSLNTNVFLFHVKRYFSTLFVYT